MNSIQKTAIEYLKRGISVIPLHGPDEPHDEPEDKRGKRPALNTWKQYQTQQPKEAEINKWFGNGRKSNLGVVTGSVSGITIVDFDSAEAVKLAKERNFPTTPLVKTGKGYHAYCRYRDGHRNFQKRADLPGIDLRGEGGYAVAPPSVHATGKQYGWVSGRGLDDVELAEVPEWIIAQSDAERTPIEDVFQGVDKGSRNEALARVAGSVIAKGDNYEEALQFCLTWNNRNKPPLPEREIEGTVKSIWQTHQRNKSISSPCHAGESLSQAGIESLEWPEPILFGDIETPDIQASLLPSWLGEYAKAVSDNTQTPPGLAVMMGLSTIATCIQKRVEVSPYGDDYKEPLALWTLTGLPPASRKTAVKSAMTAPLSMWEKEQALSLSDEIKRIACIRSVNLKRIEKLTKKAAEQEDPLERQITIDEIERLDRDTPDEIVAPRLLIDDITPERTPGVMAQHGERVGLLSDEGGIFEIMSGLYSNGRANLNVFLQAHAGASVRVDRQDRTGYLERPALSVGLTVQPDVISELSQGGKGRFRGNGLLARFLYCIPRNNIGTRDVTRRTPIPQSIKSRYQAGIYDLLSIELLRGDQGREIPRILSLSKDALQSWEQFSQYIESIQGPNGDLESIQDWSGKLPGAALRIAGLFHVIEHGLAVPVISKQTIERSLDLSELLIPHAKAAFELMADDPAYHDAKQVYKWILSRGETSFKQNEAFRELRRFRHIDRLEKALKILNDRHIISGPTRIGTGGRPSIIYLVNPLLKS